MISVLCPSRGRVEQLTGSVKSLADNAAGEFEILIAADPDDQATIEAAQKMWPPGRLIVMRERYGYAGLHEYYESMASMALGDWLMVWNDDAIMMTPGWDVIIEGLPTWIMVADIASTQSPLCCFPAVRRQAVDALGRFATANPHVDTFWQDAGRITGMIASVRVFASHLSPVKPDQTHGYYEPEHQAELAEAIDTIRAAFSRDMGWVWPAR